MSKQLIVNVSLKIKRKRAPVWPFATQSLCDQVVKLLIEDDLVQELYPPHEWRIHPSTEARGKDFQHERRSPTTSMPDTKELEPRGVPMMLTPLTSVHTESLSGSKGSINSLPSGIS
jgi:hypothetical protein